MSSNKNIFAPNTVNCELMTPGCPPSTVLSAFSSALYSPPQPRCYCLVSCGRVSSSPRTRALIRGVQARWM